MTTSRKKIWYGSPPQCDIAVHGVIPGMPSTSHDLDGQFVDGKTKMGPWAMMCLPCHRRYGVGLGTGRGQRYSLETESGEWVKVEG